MSKPDKSKTIQTVPKYSKTVPKYSKEEFLANAEAILGVKPEIIAGTLHDNNKKEFTIEEIKKLIDNFLKRKVS